MGLDVAITGGLVVDGVRAVRNNVAADVRPGMLLRSGRDTETVAVK